MQVAFALPSLEHLADRGVARSFSGNHLEQTYRLLVITLASYHLRQLRPRYRQLRIEDQRMFEMDLRIGVAALQRGCHAGANAKRSVLWIERDGLAKHLGRDLRLIRLEGVPARLLQHGDTRAVLCRQHRERKQERFHTSSPIMRINSSALLWVMTPPRSL